MQRVAYYVSIKRSINSPITMMSNAAMPTPITQRLARRQYRLPV
ncbi:hypothetical protein ACUHMQ_03085 [Chitinimonas sp. PSY-7]